MNRSRLKREILRTLEELRENIYKVDYLAIKRTGEKLKNQLLILKGMKEEEKVKKSMGLGAKEEIIDMPIEKLREIIDTIEKIVELKYPSETIYGKKIDTKALKQKYMVEWYALLREGVVVSIERI